MENHRSTQPILDAAARLISLQQSLPARRSWRGSTSACARSGPGGVARAPHPLRHGFRRGRRRGRPRRREAPGRLPSPRHGGARPQQRRRRCVPARPQRARASPIGSAAAAASTRARRCASSCTSCACSRAPKTRSRSSTWPPPRSTACPRPTSFASTSTPGARAGPLIEVMRGLPANEDLASVGGRRPRGGGATSRRSGPRGGRGAHRRTGEVLYGFLQWSGRSGRARPRGERGRRGQGAQHRPLLRDA